MGRTYNAQPSKKSYAETVSSSVTTQRVKTVATVTGAVAVLVVLNAVGTYAMSSLGESIVELF